MNNNLTILIPTSPIPSHPSTAILDETISNIRKYTDAKIILMIDGVHESLSHRTEDYIKYKYSVCGKIINGEYGDCTFQEHEHHRHQSEMMKQALKEVDTDLIFFVEHDTWIAGDIPFNEICSIVKDNPAINYIRLNIFHTILPEHQHLMINGFEIDGVNLTGTIQYSARPNIAKTNWYRDILFTWFRDGERMMLEDRIHSIVIEKYKALGYDTFGMAIYTPNGDQTRSFTSDGRKDDPKIIEA